MANSEGAFPAADAEIELNPEKSKEFLVDPVSSDIDNNKAREEEAKRGRDEKERKDALFQSLKTTILISAAAVAVAGAIFAITKKLRET